ncbi:hypothetical protein E1757_26415 [Paenibacillus piri]|uniref:G5 domain-containing protein n=2 Tax=Paenibacillus piri TaxID=2547395 RepID=A0A4R5KEC8_9BACL|nr:hypothetical protein E1757_26415 [Paenibacillus piri]
MIDRWKVGGLSVTELERQLTHKKELLLLQTVRLVSTRPEAAVPPADWTLEQLGLDVQIQAVVDKLQPLRAGSPFQRAMYRWKLRDEHWALAFEFDPAKLQATLKRGFPDLYNKQPIDAQRIIGPNDTVSYVPESAVLRIDEADLLQKLRNVVPTLDNVAWTAGLQEKSGSPQSEAKEAGHASRPKTVPAAETKPDAVQAAAGVPRIVIPIGFNKQEPGVTVRMLQAQGIERKISEFSTVFPPNGEGRLYNIRSTASSIHDQLLKPGDVFDYAPYIAATEAKFGFREAPVILNGKLVPGIGGGICQVSSTLYNAVLRAGLEIVERRNHSLPVSYVPMGQDATFASGYINFKFRNTTGGYLLIRTATDDQKLTVKLFGQIPAELTYTIESQTVETLPIPFKYVVNQTLKNGKQQKISEGKPGYIVETYRTKLQNGVPISRERISRDTYSAQPTVIARNRNGIPPGQDIQPPSPQPQTPLLEDGVKGPLFR